MKYLHFFYIWAMSLHMVTASELFEEFLVDEDDVMQAPYPAPNVTPVSHEPLEREVVGAANSQNDESHLEGLAAAMASMSVSRASTPRTVTPRLTPYVVYDASEQTPLFEKRESCDDMIAHLKEFFNPVLCLDFKKEGKEAASCCGCCANIPDWVAARLFIWAEVFTYDLIVMVKEDLEDGKLDGIGPDGKIRYREKIVEHLGLKYDPLFAKLFKPSPHTKAQKIAGNVAVRLGDAASSIAENGIGSDAAFGFIERQIQSYMKKFKRLLSKHLIKAFVKNMEDELSNGQIDGCDRNGKPVDWKNRTEQAVRSALPSIATGAFDQGDPYDYAGMSE